MQISLLGGRASDLRWLAALGAARGHTFVIAQHAQTGSVSDEGPEALLIHADERVDLTRDALAAIRSEPYFQQALAIASLSVEQLVSSSS